MSMNTCAAHNVITADYYERIPKALPIQQQSPSYLDIEFTAISPLELLEVTLNLMNQVCILLTLAGIGCVCKNLKFEKTAFHAFFCTLGFVFMLTMGMITRSPRNLILNELSPDTKHIVHFLLLGVGGILGIIGTAHKFVMKKGHFHTEHGKYGLGTCLFWSVNTILGVCTYQFMEHSKDGTAMILRLIHNFMGLVTLIMACFCQYWGYKTGFFRRNFSNQGVYRKMIILILFLTSIGPIRMCVENYLEYKYATSPANK